MLREHGDANGDGSEHVQTLRGRTEPLYTEERDTLDESVEQGLCARAFCVWKETILTRRQRKKQVEQACVIGAMFRQRLYWLRWRDYVVKRKSLATVTMPPTTQLQAPHEHQLLEIDMSEKGRKLLNVVVCIHRTRAFQQWRSIGQLVETATESKHYIQSKMARFQFRRSVCRWKAYTKISKQQSLLRQRAYFFLYYQLMKNSLLRLRKYVIMKRNEHKYSHLIGSVRCNAIKRFAMTRWSQQRLKRWILREWRAESVRKRSRSSMYRKTYEHISSKYHSSLLQQIFHHWRQHFLGKKIHHAVLNVLERNQFKLLQLAWKRWEDQVAHIVDVERLMQDRRLRLLQQSWDGWKNRTASKQTSENNRRRAVRFWYLSHLRNGFSAFQKTIERRRQLFNLAAKRRYEQQKLSLASSFTRWKNFTNTRKESERKKWIAVHHYESKLVERVWTHGFCCVLDIKHTIANKLDKIRELWQKRFVAEIFAWWKAFYFGEHDRTQLLEVKLIDLSQGKQLASKHQIFAAWAEYSHEKFAERIIISQVYGQWQLKLLQNVFTQWQTGVAATKWRQILNERAKRHYAMSLLKKAFTRWKIKNMQLQEHWRQTKLALIHWKLTLERTMFVRWKMFAVNKRRQRERIHDAFEFRQDYFLREGLRHWITAATHLHEQRETRLSNAQAIKTARIWRKVAAIARHWYHLTMKRRIETPQSLAIKCGDTTRLLPDAVDDSESWLVKRRAHLHPPAIRTRHISVTMENQRQQAERSGLSEFVMLPRTRPQPRRPVDLLLGGAPDMITQNSDSDSNKTLHNLRSKYGFQFQVEAPPSAFQVPEEPLDTRNQFVADRDAQIPSPQPRPSVHAIGDLEQQLLRWKTWKTEWKVFRAKIESVRAELEEATANRNVTEETIHAMRSNLNALEKQDLDLQQQWLESKSKIRVLAQQIQYLRASVAA